MTTAISDDLFTPDVIADPYTYLGRLREEDPVHWNELYDLWVITRHDDLVWVARHPELFSSAVEKRDPRPPYPEIRESDVEFYQYVRAFYSEWFARLDPPEHAPMRRVVHEYFTPKAIEQWRSMVQSVIKDLLDHVEDTGQMDLVRDFAIPLPVMVIASMMDLPVPDRLFIRELSQKLTFLGRGDPDRMQPLAEGIKDLVEYISPIVEERRTNPQNDLLSVLASGENSGVYSRHQAVANSISILFAGHETTINLICNGTLAFLRHPDQWELFQQDPSSLSGQATEECLRYDSPVKAIRRIATEDVEMRGKVIHKDDRIRWFISSANRDPAVFPEPDKFDITRSPNPHVAFGSGIHHCLGASLSRMEAQEAFKALAQRFPSLRLETEEVEYEPSLIFRCLKFLPVSWV